MSVKHEENVAKVTTWRKRFMKMKQRRNEFALADVTFGIQDAGKQSIVNKMHEGGNY